MAPDKRMVPLQRRMNVYKCQKCGHERWVNTATGLELECLKCGYRMPDEPDEEQTILLSQMKKAKEKSQ